MILVLDSIRETFTRWFFECRLLSYKQKDPFTIKVEKKIDRRIQKAKGFKVFPVNEYSSLVKGDKYDRLVDLARRTCTCGKYDLGRIPCRHAIPAIFSRDMEIHRFAYELYTTIDWRSACEDPGMNNHFGSSESITWKQSKKKIRSSFSLSRR